MRDDKPKIACLPNGPYYLLTDPTLRAVPHLQDAGGNPCSTITGIALCRCGGSKKQAVLRWHALAHGVQR